MNKLTFLLVLLAALSSCTEEFPSNTSEYYSYTQPIFVGTDSILYIEYYVKENSGIRDHSGPVREADVRFKIIDTNGQDIATIWRLTDSDNPVQDFNYCYAINYSKASKTITIGYSTVLYEGESRFKIMLMDLDGNILSNVEDSDLKDMAYGFPYHNFPVSPDGGYYVVNKLIKNTQAALVKVLADTVVDWNATGLLLKNEAIDSVLTEIEGTEFATYSHPDASLWFGTQHQYLDFDLDTLKICRWPDSSILRKIQITNANTSGYSPYGSYGYQSYSYIYFWSSSISPDLNYLVYSDGGIQLFNLNTEEQLTLVPSYQYSYSSE
ncbi:hypothetical protein [Maribellus sediminis]|uniref:hypothetical protein n=1 Tax=Maribellus sediminis TaxID=2696285 RepID=UPI00142F6D6E|nr:hypothetical protein [Maribellus sediminis]